MKALKMPIQVVVLILLSSCVTNRRVVINEPVGPPRPATNRRKGEGELVVHSAREVRNPADSEHLTHSSYKVYSEDGRVLRRVRNLDGSFYADPVPVRLPVGTYKVEARATNIGVVVIPVVIEEGQTTIVYLDGETLPADLSLTHDGDWIRLPDGQIVGRRTTTSASSKPFGERD